MTEDHSEHSAVVAPFDDIEENKDQRVTAAATHISVALDQLEEANELLAMDVMPDECAALYQVMLRLEIVEESLEHRRKTGAITSDLSDLLDELDAFDE